MPRLSETEKPTERLIYLAAIDLFFDQGYNATSLRQIADRVGVKVSSLYNHITSKGDLLYLIMHSVMVELLETTEVALQSVERPVDRVRTFMECAIVFHASRTKETLIGNSELRALAPEERQAIGEMRGQYERLLQSAIEEGMRNGEIDVPDARLAAFAGLAICSHVASWYHPGGRLPLEAVVDGLASVYTPLAS